MKGTKRDAILKKAESAMKDELWLDAIGLLTSFVPRSRRDWKISWNLGWCFFNLERFGEARRHFDLADATAPRNPICKWARGLVYIKKRKYRQAEEVLLESLQLKERYLTRIALALAYLGQGKVSLAEKTHLEGIKIGTRLSEKYESYAAFLSDVGREREAQEINKKVRELRCIN